MPVKDTFTQLRLQDRFMRGTNDQKPSDAATMPPGTGMPRGKIVQNLRNFLGTQFLV